MKQISFETSKGKFLAVLLPKANFDRIWILRNELWFKKSSIRYMDRIILPQWFEYEILSPLSEMNEELWKEVVDYRFFFSQIFQRNLKNYKNYKNHEYTYISAFDAGEALMQSLGIYLVNPLGTNPYLMTVDQREWTKYQENVGNWILLKLL